MVDKIVIIKLDVQEAGASAQIQKLNTDLSKLTQGTNEYDLVLKKIAIQEDRLINIQNKRATAQGNVLGATNQATKSLKKQKDATGAATAATLEFGRAISDAPYGIRGVANNISQFASQFSFMANTVDQATGKVIGFDGAMKNLGRAMKANAILLVIQTIIAAFDYFAGGAEKAQKANESLTKSFDDLISKLGDLEGKLPDAIAGLFERLGLSNKEFDEFALNMAETLKILNNEFPEFKNAYDKLSETQKNDPKQIANIIEKYRELITTRKKIAKQEEFLKKLNKENGEYAESNLQRNRKIYKELILQKIGLEEIFKTIKEGKETKKDKIKLIEFEDFNETAENYRSELGKLTEQFELINAKSEVEKLQIKKKYHLARLDAQHVESTQKYEQTAIEYKAELKLYLDQQVLLGLMSKEESARKLQEFDENTNVQVSQSQKSFDTLRGIQKAFYDNQILEASTAGLKLAGNGNTRATQENIDLLAHLKRKSDAYASYAETVKEVLSSVSDFIDSEFQRELIIEQNKTNSANQALNDRLLNENLSKDQRASIQNQIAQNDEKLRVKQEKVARKQFAVEKAFKIGMAIADTASSALRAFSSQINPLDSTSLARAVVAAKVATAFGLAQVAMIARTKFQSSAPASPANASLGGGSGGGSGRAEPSFNIVGRSNENIILKAIQSQFDQPLKAYVVARDVTNQQQLDGIISNTSSI